MRNLNVYLIRIISVITICLIAVNLFAPPVSASDFPAVTSSYRLISPYGYAAWCGNIISRTNTNYSPSAPSHLFTVFSYDTSSWLTPNFCPSDLMASYPGTVIMISDIYTYSPFGWWRVPECHREKVSSSNRNVGFNNGYCEPPVFGGVMGTMMVVQAAWDNNDGRSFKYMVGVVTVYVV